MSVRRFAVLALGIVVLITIVLSTINRGFSHTGFILGLWTTIALIVTGIYGIVRSIRNAPRRS